MTLALRWTSDATNDLLGILDYIGERNVVGADRLNDLVQRTAEQLPDHPYLYRPGRVPGTREAVVHPNYILVYRVGEAIDVLAVLHARQQYP